MVIIVVIALCKIVYHVLEGYMNYHNDWRIIISSSTVCVSEK